MENITSNAAPWNKGKLVGQKLPLKLKEIWAIRVRLHLAGKTRDLALFNLAIDSKLRGSDLVRIRVSDICNSGIVSSRAMILQKKTSQPVQFEITERTRETITEWIAIGRLSGGDYLFPSRIASSPHLSTRQYARIVERWVSDIGLDSAVRDALAATDEADADLQKNQESPRCAAVARTHEAGKHGAVSGC